jgi:dTDP-4-amino-4,6-dideoxygalactose transaminase
MVADDELFQRFRDIFASGNLTNGTTVAEFERQVARYLEVEDVIAVNSCTAGLMLVLRCLSTIGGVILPSFTFMASGHAVLWCGLRPHFADCTLDSFTLDPQVVSDSLDGEASAVLGVHTFGIPCDADELAKAATAKGAELILDAAHGMGGRYPDGTRIGSKGLAEVFSLSPTKPLSTVEGGLISTNNADLARELRIARNYGNPGNYDSRVIGLNGRMTELSAAIGLYNLPLLDRVLERRRGLASRYADALAQLPLGLQRIPAGCVPTYKDFTVLVESQKFGLSRGQLAKALAAEGIGTRAYFDPPLHRQTAYAGIQVGEIQLLNTVTLSQQCLSLPLYSHMPTDLVDTVSEAITAVYTYRDEITAALRGNK